MPLVSVVLHSVWNLICFVGAASAANKLRYRKQFAAKAAPTGDLLVFTLSLVNNATPPCPTYMPSMQEVKPCFDCGK